MDHDSFAEEHANDGFEGFRGGGRKLRRRAESKIFVAAAVSDATAVAR
jgi:hypothetical protein